MNVQYSQLIIKKGPRLVQQREILIKNQTCYTSPQEVEKHNLELLPVVQAKAMLVMDMDERTKMKMESNFVDQNENSQT